MTVLTGALLGIFYLYFFILIIRILFVPLAVAHETRAWNRKRKGIHGLPEGTPIAVVVPAFNEEAVIESCLLSIIGAGYKNLEVIVVDDGSSDRTVEIASRVAGQDDRIRVITQVNSGKGAALNNGFKHTDTEIVLFIDADSVFTKVTIPEMLRGFASPAVGAVCGDDRPVNLNKVQTRFLALITHLGTGLVRRAMDMLGCMPVVSGNCGAFRREALMELMDGQAGPLREDTVGEDLELTWRLHRSKWKVAFQPRALVLAESPSTIGGLWRQRVRWSRGLLQSLALHWRAMFKLRYGAFSLFLWFTVITMVIVPILQVVTVLVFLGVIAWNYVTGTSLAPGTSINYWALLLELGLITSVSLLIIAMILSGSLRDLRHIWTLPIWPIYSFALNFAFLQALSLELRRRPNKWNKPARTGVISYRNIAVTSHSQQAGLIPAMGTAPAFSLKSTLEK